MNEKNEIYKKIFAMHTIMRSLNDEELLMWWLEECVPDGTDTLEDVIETYGHMDEKELADEFETIYTIFAKIVRSATADGYKKWIC